ncbi:MAG: tripartite tricarboxylate transporter TctB family protein [Proteobacteria bacterium]|nr:tripartite tricarboxylate transporter TctB family protein [Pseudomonadota bacterium]MBU1966119.1 tripartite tricarboxylate transporter TctB family protein [Pseudomonadota bacterium]
MKKGEIVLGAFCVAFFSFMFYEAFKLHGVGRFGEVGSGFWPMLSLGVAVILSLSWLVSTFVALAKEKGKAAEKPTPETIAAAGSRRKKVALSVVCILVYIIVMPWIGFILSTFLFVPAFAIALGERRRLVLIISPFLITAITILVFAKFITIPFPKGAGIFVEFSRLFY